MVTILLFTFLMWVCSGYEVAKIGQFVSSSNGTTVQFMQVQLLWTGGPDECTVCQEGRLVTDYACSDGRGNWNDGVASFNNTIPPNNHITSIDVMLSGRFNCQIFQPRTDIFVIFQEFTMIHTKDLPVQPFGCSCGNCIVDVNFTAVPPDGWNYNYSIGGQNILRVIVDSNAICLHSILITLYYEADAVPNHHDSILDDIEANVGWIVAGGVVFLLLVLGLGVFLWTRLRRRRSNYNPLLDDDGHPVPNFTEGFEEIDVSELKIGPRIGKGSFAEVFKAEWRGILVAVKKLPAHALSEEFFKDFESEAALMKHLRHPNVLLFLGACMMPPDICILMEYMQRGSLYRILHDSTIRLPWDLRRRMAIDAARGMNYLHRSDPIILHRDLKSHNLLVDENWKVKVCDFGLSRIVEQTLSATLTSCGTPCWTAPEVLRNMRYTEKADVYSFGIVLWEMATREDPYRGMPPFQVVFAVGTQKIRPSVPSSCPSGWARLMVDCWAEDPEARPSFDEVIQRLQHLNEDEASPSTSTSSATSEGTSISRNPQDSSVN